MGVFRSFLSLFLKNRLISALLLAAFLVTNLGLFCIGDTMQRDLRRQESYREQERRYTVAVSGEAAARGLQALVAEEKGALQHVFVSLRAGGAPVTADFYADCPPRISVMYGSDFSAEDLRAGTKKILTPDLSFTDGGEKMEFPAVGEAYSLWGQRYTVIGVNSDPCFRIPYASILQPSAIESVFVVTKRLYTGGRQNAFVQTLKRTFGVESIALPAAPAGTDNGLRLQYLLIGCLFLLGFLNVSYLYAYLLGLRRRQYAVFRICGCSVARGVRQCLTEVWLLATLAFAAGALLYRAVLAPLLRHVDASLVTTLGAADYALYYAGYLIALLAVFLPVIFVPMRRSPWAAASR